MKERFPILMWAEMFQTSPKFSYLYGLTKVLVAIDLCLKGDPSPWKSAQAAIEGEETNVGHNGWLIPHQKGKEGIHT